MANRAVVAALGGAVCAFMAGCSASDSEGGARLPGDGPSPATSSTGAGSPLPAPTSGGGLVVDPTSGGNGSSAAGEDCGRTLIARIRDFTEQHPDFEGPFGGGGLRGIVLDQLGADGKPVYAHPGPTAMTTGPAEFGQWYNDVVNVNFWIDIQIEFSELSPGVYVYDNSAFFPIDNQAFGNGPVDILGGLLGTGAEHNFLFTTEIHTLFTYNGGEVFTFTGDDDLWMFVNGRLAIDLGGLHSAMSATADMDALAGQLGIQAGETYPMDIFHAERHTNESNFRIETTIECFTPVEIR